MSQTVLDKLTTEATQPKRLGSENTRVYRGEHGVLFAEVHDDDGEPSVLYQGVFAVLAFPVSHPESFVSLRYFPVKDREQEIGMIEDPMQFDPETVKLLAQALAGHYFEFQVTRVNKAEMKWGLLLFDVMTRQGPRQFEMRWSSDRTQDLGKHGKVLLDVNNNRFVIEDMRRLPLDDRARFRQYIYW